MVDVEAGEQEKPGHPENHEGDVRGHYPKMGGSKPADIVAHFAPFTMLSNCSTCAIGVSGKMPCPRLKMCGRPANASRTRVAAERKDLPPAISARGSRFPCTGRSSGSSFAAHNGSTVSSRPTAVTLVSLA